MVRWYTHTRSHDAAGGGGGSRGVFISVTVTPWKWEPQHTPRACAHYPSRFRRRCTHLLFSLPSSLSSPSSLSLSFYLYSYRGSFFSDAASAAALPSRARERLSFHWARELRLWPFTFICAIRTYFTFCSVIIGDFFWEIKFCSCGRPFFPLLFACRAVLIYAEGKRIFIPFAWLLRGGFLVVFICLACEIPWINCPIIYFSDIINVQIFFWGIWYFIESEVINSLMCRAGKVKSNWKTEIYYFLFTKNEIFIAL